MRAGDKTLRGTRVDADGCWFSVFAGAAERVELCLFDASGHSVANHDLPGCDDGVWHGYLPGAEAGLLYGYRVHGRFDPAAGRHCNPQKLLIDPYARELVGELAWSDAVFGYDLSNPLQPNRLDSAGQVPFCRLRSDDDAVAFRRPQVPWGETLIYEANVRGYTMRHDAVPDDARGRFDGMRAAAVLDHLRALGVTSIELMPVHAFADEHHLVKRSLRNLWGYNSMSFFAPAPRYASSDGIREFRAMVRAFHDAGIEVILDVVYNHTAEADGRGPTFGFRGLDNLAYYRTDPANASVYVNDTGCGNTLNVDHPEVQRLVRDSLSYWHVQMGVDGFRFDLAPVLGRHADGFSPQHPLLHAIDTDARLAQAKLIAEPWDPGPGGYQLGAFPVRFGEWNDRYRDAVRRFWRGDPGAAADLADALRASAAVFDQRGRSAWSSVNLVAAHDGFTTADVVSYNERHNAANGEDNRDGHAHNYSYNHGVEGPSEDPQVNALRRRQRLNLLATLLFSQGTPMLLGGDEFGNSQGGNNNAYAQDNATGWLDWSGLEGDAAFFRTVCRAVRVRRELPLLRLVAFVHDGCEGFDDDAVSLCIDWRRPDGETIGAGEWQGVDAFHLRLLAGEAGAETAVSVLINRRDGIVEFQLRQEPQATTRRLAFTMDPSTALTDRLLALPGPGIAVVADTPTN